MYAVQAQIIERREVRKPGGRILGAYVPAHTEVYEVSRQIPTFYLDENVQGFGSEAGVRAVVLHDIIRPRENEAVYLSVVKID